MQTIKNFFNKVIKLIKYTFFVLIGIGILGTVLEFNSDEAKAERIAQAEAKVQAQLLAEQQKAEEERVHLDKMQNDPRYAFDIISEDLDSEAFYMTRNYVRKIIKNPKSLDWDGHNTWKVFYTDGTPEQAGYIKVVQHFYGQNGFGAEVRSAVEGIFIVNTQDQSLTVKSFTVL